MKTFDFSAKKSLFFALIFLVFSFLGRFFVPAQSVEISDEPEVSFSVEEDLSSEDI